MLCKKGRPTRSASLKTTPKSLKATQEENYLCILYLLCSLHISYLPSSKNPITLFITIKNFASLAVKIMYINIVVLPLLHFYYYRLPYYQAFLLFDYYWRKPKLLRQWAKPNTIKVFFSCKMHAILIELENVMVVVWIPVYFTWYIRCSGVLIIFMLSIILFTWMHNMGMYVAALYFCWCTPKQFICIHVKIMIMINTISH